MIYRLATLKYVDQHSESYLQLPSGMVLPYQEVGGGGGGGLDLASSLEAKFGAKFSQVHQIRGKIWGVLLLQDAKIGKESHGSIRSGKNK